MNRIRLLPEHVANQIAAGEVVERPASVIKELVENALDACPSRVIVEIQAGGRSLMRVTDDGVGMSRDDALLCLERHATSKIQRAEDLAAIATMGFRGEALPSIASVCRMILTTREREGDPAATQVVLNGGKIVEVKAAGSPAGTCIEVRQLFFNLPARRKFLRSEETEAGHIQHYLTVAALAWPQVGFSFIKDGRQVWQLPGVKTGEKPAERLSALRERMRNLFGNADQLLTVDATGNLNETGDETESADHAASTIRLWGLMGKPGISRSTRDEQYLFVNRRPVQNQALNHGLLEGYHTALMKGRYPICCLFVDVDPAVVDVNIHPSKREVKFRQPRQIQNFVANAVRKVLVDYHGPTAPEPVAIQAPPEKPAPPPEPAKEFPQFTALTGTPLQQWPKPPLPPAHPAPRPAVQPVEHATPEPGPSASPLRPPCPPSPPWNQRDTPTPLLKVPLRLVGVIGRLYVVLESDRGLVLLDQHAAHERILFEQMMTRLEQGAAPSQRLLLPETIEVSSRDAQFLRELMPTLNRLGVGLSEFGERTFLLDALPPFVKGAEPRKFVVALIDELKATGQEVNTLRLGEDTVAKTVCRHAVKANDPLNEPELENLIADLRQCTMPYTCPHGRPTLIEMNFRELEKKFGRTG